MNSYEELRNLTVEQFIELSKNYVAYTELEGCPSWIGQISYMLISLAAMLEEPINDEMLLKLCYCVTELIKIEVECMLSNAIPEGYEEWLKSG